MRKIRIVSQVVFFVLFVSTFFLIVRYPTGYTLPAPWMLRLNPLVSLTTSVAARTIILPIAVMGLAMTLLTIVFGRFFCGFVCPLGACIDFSDRYVVGKARSPKRRPPAYLRRLKYVLLILVAVTAVFGAVFPLFMDPISLLTRITTLVVNPLLRVVKADAVQAGRILGFDRLNTVVVDVPLVYGTAGALLLAVVVFAGGFWDRRFWCQYVCPSGAFFGLLGRYAPFRRTVRAESCNSCKRCTRCCPTRAIDPEKVERTALPECIVCGQCTDLKQGCSRFTFVKPVRGATDGADLRRRNLLVGAAGGLALLPLFRSNALSRRTEHGRLIRPPGALPEDQFLARCIACGNCMKACPTQALQPCSSDDGLHRLFTPKLVPRVGACEDSCHLCGYTCPTGAIRRLPHDDKEFAKIGTAVLDRHRCLAWSQNKECLVCDEVCPYNAIEARVEQTTKGPFKVPVVFEDYCIGCGMCEHHCPISVQAAIVVYSFGENRRAHGPYASERQKSAIRERRRKSDAHLSVTGPQEQDMPPHSPEQLPPGFDPGPAESGSTETDLPPGFLE
ncbi:MAG: 4Fe-4S dicluster domain-containing protein [Chitinivibrionales bacterium]|nr:4Fe-4S dicluster domain-containing protein [Chitinivibrionales bacterium]